MKPFTTLPAETLELLGLTPKDLRVYVALLRLGSAPLRRIAEEAALNRSTTYDTLKRLLADGLVGYVDAKKHRYFTAEDPQKLRAIATRREVDLQEARSQITSLLPHLRQIAGEAEHRPVVRYYEGDAGIRTLLEDVLSNTKRTRGKTYRVYSASGIRERIADAWPTWNEARKNVGVRTRAIAIGEGGTTAGLDERRWLSQDEGSPTYIFIYGSKTAYVAIDEHQKLFGVIIEDLAIAKTQQIIFDQLWKNLGAS